MIRYLLLATALFLGFASSGHGQTRDTYTIRDIEVDERADTVIEAQQRAFTSARIQGVYRLIERLTLPEDRQGKVFNGLVDVDTANRLAAAVDVEEETRGGGRYVGKLAVVYNPVNFRAYLDQLAIPYIDSAAPMAVIFPVTSRTDPYAWSQAWPDSSIGRLAPYTTSKTLFATPDSPWYELQGEVEAAGARRAIKANLIVGQSAFRVEMVSLTPSGETPLGMTGWTSTLEDAVSAASQLLDDIWKEQAIVRTSERTPGRSTVFFTSLVEWNSLRGALARSPLVFDFAIEGLSREGAVVKFVYAGDEQRLITNLRERGVSLEPDDLGWVMTSATTQTPFE